jgi:hypothetical protein
MTMRPSIFILWIAMSLALSGEVLYQATTIETQAHTIKEQLGQAIGPDATPRSSNCYPDYKGSDSMAVPCEPVLPPKTEDPANDMPQRRQNIL